ncbi:molybdate ABC transporter substrate-binding protein [Simiduia aestuariiviva]|uniref:Molybdate transport system substrate-binding protein n=1 Tax=Simiduia aestuariiviva TaxID=1510459 RepID=A0A839UKM7_9GAMM|nr:molybdate ABC transporter substrate-binding protein [Simiduia aestuariiviva]MBB3167160.1 molybdate transport system substrate-binding protein [Simiduia aestuariiviva]
MRSLCFVWALFWNSLLLADATPLRVAVASNFSPALNELIPDFNAQHPDIELLVSTGASGQLFAQITQGAPFDVYLAANGAYPQQLHAQGLAAAPVTYAHGRLLLISRHADPDWLTVLGNTQRLAIANPKLAPYGAAAQSLIARATREKSAFNGRILTANAVAQVQHWFAAGHVDSAFAAASMQPVDADYPQLDVTHLLAAPIIQQLAVLHRTRHAEAADALVQFLQSRATQAQLQRLGYAALTPKEAQHAQR